MTTISAKSILASRQAQTGDTLHTLLLRLPRCILAELLTHRVFTRSSASSRAIPVKKMIRDVIERPFVPLYWGANQKGMQADKEVPSWKITLAKMIWRNARWGAIALAFMFDKLGLHKQICNRVLEPWAHITVLVTSTQWANFLALRLHTDAEPHMQMLAREVRKALDGAEVQTLQPGEWHLPFISEGDRREYVLEEMKILSVARCASTSYKTVEGFDMDMLRATEIYEKLRTADPIHASPFEHVAQADDPQDCVEHGRGKHWFWKHGNQHRNFRGFRQLRAMIEGE